VTVIHLEYTSIETIINVPDNYPTIQEGIDTSTDGDTVLVQPGTYYENINFNGHNIELGSLFLMTGDTNYISQTIIDGDLSGSVITLVSEEHSTAVITGFTIQNGYAVDGGGIYCYNTDPIISSNMITGNHASEGDGGGIFCEYHSDPIISNNTINDNSADRGGGIYCFGITTNPTIIDNTINDNSARCGGAIYLWIVNSSTIGNNNITGNTADIAGGIWSVPSTSGNVSVENNIIIGNSATSSSGGGIYHAGKGTIDNNIITGNSADSGHGGGIFYSGNTNSINNNFISGNSATHGAGIYCWSEHFGSEIPIFNNIITENLADSAGGGIYFLHIISSVKNNSILRNSADFGAGIYCRNSRSTMINNTISENSADEIGGGIYSCNNSLLVMKNSILWADTAYESCSEIYVDSTSISNIAFCNIQEGWTGEGNIDIDPLFRDPENGDFHLQSITNPDCGGPGDSPCIDAGDPTILDSFIDCDWGLGVERSDMGAYGGGDSVQVSIYDRKLQVPDRFMLAQNYPNPFNTITIISYDLHEPLLVVLNVYDLLGRKVEMLVNTEQSAGRHQIIWNADDHSSGVYFYKLQAGEYSEIKKMLLLK